MKVLYCQQCGDITAPNPVALVPKWCRCGRHAIWWVNPLTGIVRVHDQEGPSTGPALYNVTGWVLGITNAFLNPRLGVSPVWERAAAKALETDVGIHRGNVAGPPYDRTKMGAEDIQRIIDEHDEHYLFKTLRSCIVRIKPGESSDSAYSELPPGQVPARYREPGSS